MDQDTFQKRFKLLKEQMLESINLFTELLEDVELDTGETSDPRLVDYIKGSFKEMT